MKTKIRIFALLVLTLSSAQSLAASATTYAYNTNGLLIAVDGPRPDVADITRYEHDIAGNISNIITADGGRTRFSSFNEFGLPGQVISPSGVVTTLTYTEEGWLSTSSTLGKITRHTYNESGDITEIKYPDGSWMRYFYDDARRFIGQDESTGRRIRFVLDSMGNRTKSAVTNVAGGSTASVTTAVYDELGRIISETDGNGNVTKYEYDVSGNLLSSTSPRGYKTQYGYDELNRRTTSTNALGSVTSYTYDSSDKIIKVVAPGGSTTEYTYDYNENVTKVISADSGTTVRTFDEASNLTKSVDARGVITEYSYDNLNRLRQKKFPATPNENITLGYGVSAEAGHGRLAQVIDSSGSAYYYYTPEGELRANSFIPAGRTKGYGRQYHRNANNQISLESSPHLKITYDRDAAANITAIKLEANGSTTYVAQAITYKNSGLVDSLRLGNGMPVKYYYDKNLNLHGQKTGTSLFSATRDANGNTISANLLSEGASTFKYDALDRLIEEKSGNIIKSYQWDELGNRTQRLTKDAATGNILDAQTLAYSHNSNVLASINGEIVPKDAAGNLLQSNGRRYVYNSEGRLSEVYNTNNVKIAEYKYNYLGQRVEQRLMGNYAPQTTIYEYGTQGELVSYGTFNASGAFQPKMGWIWFDGRPLAQVNFIYETGGQLKSHQISYLQVDHLGAPRRALGDNGSVMWRWRSDAFGVGEPDIGMGADSGGRMLFDVPPRFPGQVADTISALHYNYFRDYDPITGRYIQSDPIGLAGGLNTYTYVGGNPQTYTDPHGLYANFAIGFGIRAVGGRALAGAIGEAARQYGAAGMIAACALAGVCTFQQETKTPNNGLPGSHHINPGSGQERVYGLDGKPDYDIDWDHDHGQGVPHAHNWERLPGGDVSRGPGVPVSRLPNKCGSGD